MVVIATVTIGSLTGPFECWFSVRKSS